MFHKTSLRLAGFYLTVLMVLSLAFSIGVYSLSVRELERGFDRQSRAYDDIIGNGLTFTFDRGLVHFDPRNVLRESRNRVIARLTLINIGIFISGGLLSYYLARRTLEPIEEAHEAQGRFTADASHELRTPITAMTSEIEMALTDKKLSLAQAKKQLSSNLEELHKLAALSDNLLKLARLEGQEPPMRKTDVSEILQAAIDKVLPIAEQKGVLLVPNLPEKLSVKVNRQGLTDALVTILDNAIKYSPPKSQVLITGSDQKNRVEIRIKDQGIGIKAAELPHIFERFYRADSARSNSQTNGYGLGLSIAQSIISRNKGEIRVKSAPSKGTTFYIDLPK